MSRKVFSVWYRAVTPSGSLLCETSNPAEVLRLTDDDERVLQKFITYTVTDGWEPWDGEPVEIRR